MTKLNDRRKYAPATERNREPILDVLRRVLPPEGVVLEIASGTGEHAVFFAPRLLPRQWLPSDPNPESRASIAAWQEHFGVANVYPPVAIDVTTNWSIDELVDNLGLANPITAIVCINMIHIAPWAACLGLMAGASKILPSGGILYLYGPFKQGYQHTAPSNQTFDLSLRAQNPEWGVRDLEEVVAVANAQNFNLLEVVQMPANNLSVVFQRC